MRHGAHRTRMRGSDDSGSVPAAWATRVGARSGVRQCHWHWRSLLAIDPFAQFLPHLEERDALGGHRNPAPGARVASLARLAVLHDEAAEAANLDPVPAPQRGGQTA